MRHRVAGYTLGRKTQHRRAMWRNMAVSLLTHGQITTTLPKARSVQPFVEKLITAAKKGDLASRRRAMRMLGQDHIIVTSEDDASVQRNRYGEIVRAGGKQMAPRIVKHLFEEVGPRYADRDGGYTRIIKLAQHRIGDGADLCVIQLVGQEEGPQVAGQFSRRREKANKRMEFAAQLRKGGKAEKQQGGEQQPDLSEPAEEGRTAPGSPSDQHKASLDDAEPRKGDNAEGAERQD